MTPEEHEAYANDLLVSLSDWKPANAVLNFVPNRTQKGNAARAITAILCQRLFQNSKEQPTHTTNTTYEWKNGIFNCRNLVCTAPTDTTLSVWVLPEPVLHDSLAGLPSKGSGQDNTVIIRPDDQRIENSELSPDLHPYFQSVALSPQELRTLDESRQIDDAARAAKKEQVISREEDESNDADSDDVVSTQIREMLATLGEHLNDVGAFDPEGVTDARERVLSAIVRRHGQPAFRQRLLAAYNGRCAISGCDVEAVLDAAHIVPYHGAGTNHPGNGLLLRTDLHTLFDLKLIAVDVETMTLLVAPKLCGTCYEAHGGKAISLPEGRERQPSLEALKQHRKESGL